MSVASCRAEEMPQIIPPMSRLRAVRGLAIRPAANAPTIPYANIWRRGDGGWRHRAHCDRLGARLHDGLNGTGGARHGQRPRLATHGARPRPLSRLSKVRYASRLAYAGDLGRAR